MHLRKGSFRSKCPLCLKVFVNKTALKYHVKDTGHTPRMKLSQSKYFTTATGGSLSSDTTEISCLSKNLPTRTQS